MYWVKDEICVLTQYFNAIYLKLSVSRKIGLISTAFLNVEMQFANNNAT